MSDKLNIANEMRQFDRKDRNFYKDLTDEERKKFSNYLMIRWGSAVEGSRELQEFYLIATNERFNKHFFTLSRHPELQWLCATTVSPDMGTPRHNWIAPKKKEPGASGIRKQLAELYPHLKDDDIAVLASITTKKEIDEHLKLLGQETKK
jgi:hypothetical protein